MKSILIALSLITFVIAPVSADITYVVVGDSIARGNAAYGSRLDTAPSGWNPSFVSHSGTLAGELQTLTGHTVYNNAIGGEVSGVPGTNGALSNTPEGLKNRWYRDAVGGTDMSLTDSPRPNKTLDAKPSVIIAMIGANDCAYNGSSYAGYSWTVETTQNNIYWMTKNATENGVKTLWLTPTPVNDYCSKSYISSLREWELNNLSKITKVYDTYSFFNDPARNGYVKAEYAADEIHLNDAAWTAVSPHIYSDFMNIFIDIPPTINPGFSVNGSGYAIAKFSTPSRMTTFAKNPDTGAAYSSYVDVSGESIIVWKSGGLGAHDPILLRYNDIVYIWRA